MTVADANIKAEAEVVVNTSGIGDAVKKATTQANDAADKATKKSRKSQTDEAAKSAKEQERIAKKRADAEAKLLEKQAREEKRGQDASQREYQRYQERLTRLHQDEVAKRAQRELEAERKNLATRKKEWQAFWKSTRGLATTVAGGAAAGAVVAAGSARRMAGIDDVQTRVEKAREFKGRFARVAGLSGLDDKEQTDVLARIQAASAASGKSQLELLAVLESAQGAFNNIRGTAAALSEIATVAQATGSDANDFAITLGRMRDAFSLSDDQMKEVSNLIVATSAAGAIEAKDMAGAFAPVFGQFAANTGLTGMRGVRESLGMAQALGTLGATPAETATLMKRFTQSLHEKKTQDKLKSVAGIDVEKDLADPSVGLGGIVVKMATNKKLNARGGFEKVFGSGDVLTTEANQALRNAYNRVQSGEVKGAIDMNTIANVDSASGSRIVSQSMGNLEKSGVLEADRLANSVQQDTIDNFKLYNDQIMGAAKATEDLRIAMGDFGRTLGLWSDAAAATGIGAGVTGALTGNSGGGMLSAAGNILGGTAIAKGVGSLAAKLGLGGAGAGALSTAGLWAGGVALAGGAGYAAGKGIDAVSAWGREDGKSWSERLEAMVNESIDKRRQALEAQGRSGPMPTVDVNAMVAEQRKTTQATKELASLLPKRPAPPVTGNRGAR